MKELALLPEARSELDSAMQWYERQRPGLGVEFNEAVEVLLDLIEAKPQRGWKYGDSGHRVLPIKRFPYHVYYWEGEDVVWVYAIAHERQLPGYWKNRTPG